MNSEVSTYTTWSCNYDQRKKLVNALLGRTDFLLPIRFSWNDIKFGNSPQQQVENLVDGCLKCPGRIELMVDELFSSYGRDPQPMSDVFTVLDEILNLPVPWEKVTQLKSLLNQVGGMPKPEELLKICSKCLPTETLPKEVLQKFPERDTLVYLTDWLVRKGQLSTGKVPILEFVRRLTPDVNDSKALDTWIKDVARHFQLTPKEADQLGQDPVCSSPKSSYLLIKLDQADPNLDTYHVQAWLAKNAEKEPPVIYSSSEAKLLAETAQVVDNILNNIVHKQFSITHRKLTIEFFLPKELLCHEVDQWVINPDIDERLGSHYRVVVRSSDRLENLKLFNRLKDYWWNDILQTSPEACMIWLDKSEWKGVKTHLENYHLFFTLKFVPDSNFLFKLIQLGVPLVLWPRQLNDGKEETQKLHQLLSGSTCPKVEQVPEILRLERLNREEANDTTCITYHLSLLWDVPDRRPPLMKLEAPT